MSGTVFAHVIHQFSDNIQLMVAREDDLGFGLNPLGTIRILGFLFFLLDIDKLLDDVQQLVLLPDLLPEVAGHIVAIFCWRITCAAVPACTVATLIKGEERCLVSVNNRRYCCFIKINGKVGQNALILTKTRFLGIAVIHPLAFGVIDGLAGKLIFQLNRHNRNAVQRQHHINGVIVRFRIMPLPDALADILLVIFHCQCVQSRLRCKIADRELNAAMLEAVAQHFNQTDLLHGAIERLVELADRIDVAHPLKATPCHWLAAFYEVGQCNNVQCHAAIHVVAIAGVICLCPAAFR